MKATIILILFIMLTSNLEPIFLKKRNHNENYQTMTTKLEKLKEIGLLGAIKDKSISDSEKLDRLRKILSKQIAWYRLATIQRDHEDVDSWIYDCLIEEFATLKRVDYLDIIQILNDDH